MLLYNVINKAISSFFSYRILQFVTLRSWYVDKEELTVRYFVVGVTGRYEVPDMGAVSQI